MSKFSDLGGFHVVPAAVRALLRHLDFIEQIGVTVEHLEQLDQGQGGLVLPFSYRKNALTPSPARRRLRLPL